MKKTFFAEEYVAPALEVVSTTVEAGFSASLAQLSEDNWDEI